MGGGGGGQRGRTRATLSEINVTPLVDVMLVLLIMFMVTVPMMQQGIEIDLPETASSGVDTVDETMVLAINKKGKIMIGEAEVKKRELRKRLRAIFENRKNKQIYIKANKTINYGLVAEIMGEVRAAGIFNISLITLPKGR